jgi:octaprenyl-diphosphate synthase
MPGPILYNDAVSTPEGHNQATTYQEVVARYAADLEAVEKSIFSRLESRNELLQSIATYITGRGGKRLRPLLVILCSKLNGYTGRDHISLGNVVEYLHAATLLHDDVLDNASLRRGSASANEKWGNHFAVLGGDFLYTTAFDILLQRFPREIIRILCRSSLDMIEGEVLQRQWRGRPDISEATYFEIISLKTASLISACCRTGGMLGGVPPSQVESLAEFGRLLGTAFQVIDDTLDYTADPEKLGKTLGGDLRQSTVTLPLIYLLHDARLADRRDELAGAVGQEEIDDGTVATIIELLQKYDCGGRAMARAADLARSSKEQLRSFKDSPVYPALSAAADFIIHRSH